MLHVMIFRFFFFLLMWGIIWKIVENDMLISQSLKLQPVPDVISSQFSSFIDLELNVKWNLLYIYTTRKPN